MMINFIPFYPTKPLFWKVKPSKNKDLFLSNQSWRPCEPPLPPPLPRAPSGGETSSERLGQRWPPSTGATLEDVWSFSLERIVVIAIDSTVYIYISYK